MQRYKIGIILGVSRLESKSQCIVVNLFLETDEGKSRKIEGRAGNFGLRTSYLFYAAIGVVPGAYYRRDVFQGRHTVRIVIEFEDFPWQVGLMLKKGVDDTVVWRNPPRYYGRPNQKVEELVTIPESADTYKLTIVDTGTGAPPSNTGYTRVTVFDTVEGSTVYVGSGETVDVVFQYDPAAMATAVPTPAPINGPLDYGNTGLVNYPSGPTETDLQSPSTSSMASPLSRYRASALVSIASLVGALA